MIIRRNRNGKESDTFTFQLQYSDVDVKRIFHDFYVRLKNLDWLGEAMGSRSPWSQEEILYTVANHPYFSQFQKKHREKLAAWAMRLAVERKYIIPCITHKGFFLLSSALFSHVGHPSREESAEK